MSWNLCGRARIIIRMAKAMKYVSSHNRIISNHHVGEIYKSSHYTYLRASIFNMIVFSFEPPSQDTKQCNSFLTWIWQPKFLGMKNRIGLFLVFVQPIMIISANRYNCES